MDREIATKVVACFDAIFEKGNEALYLVNNACPEGERARYQEVLGRMVSDIDLQLLEPIYKEFPDLRPEGMEEIKGP